MEDEISRVMDDVVMEHKIKQEKAVVKGKTFRDNVKYVRRVRPLVHPRISSNAESFNPEMVVYGVCDFCGYDAEAAVKYQSKQNDEKLTPEEYAEEVDFYLFESHPDFCEGMRNQLANEAESLDAESFGADYLVQATDPTYMYMEVKADNEEEALEIAEREAKRSQAPQGWKAIPKSRRATETKNGIISGWNDGGSDKWFDIQIKEQLDAESFEADDDVCINCGDSYNPDLSSDRIMQLCDECGYCGFHGYFKPLHEGCDWCEEEEEEEDDWGAESFEAPAIYRGARPSPSTSATSVNVGTRMRGGNGKLWVCKTYPRGNKRVKRWVLAAEGEDMEIDDRDIWNPEREAIDQIRGNRALREQLEEQGVHVGRHPGYYDDSGRWVEKEGYHDYDVRKPVPLWVQIGIVVGALTGVSVAAKKGWLNFGYGEPLPDQNETEDNDGA